MDMLAQVLLQATSLLHSKQRVLCGSDDGVLAEFSALLGRDHALRRGARGLSSGRCAVPEICSSLFVRSLLPPFVRAPFADLPGDDRGVDDLRARDAWWQREQRCSSDEESIQVTTEEEPSRASHRTWAPRLLRLQHRVQHRDDHLHGQLQGSCDTVPTSASVPCGSRSPRAPVSRPCVVGLPRSCSISSASSIATMLRGIPVLRPLAAVSRAVWTGVRT